MLRKVSRFGFNDSSSLDAESNEISRVDKSRRRRAGEEKREGLSKTLTVLMTSDASPYHNQNL